MIPLLTRPPQLPFPTRGLQGIWFLGRNNLLLDPRDFSSANWNKIRSYVAANCAADPVSGAYTVDKLVEDGTATNTHSVYQAGGVASTYHTQSVRLKAAGRSKVLLYVPVTGRGYGFDLSAGTTSAVTGITAPAAFSIASAPDGYYDCTIGETWAASGGVQVYLLDAFTGNTYSGLGHQGTAAAGGGLDTVVFAAGASAVDGTYVAADTLYLSGTPTVARTITAYVGATKTATFTPALASGTPDGQTYTTGPGILIARAQLNAGSTAYEFQDRGTQQTLPIYRGTAGTLQRGATTGAEASDPGLRNDGLSFVTDDYVRSSSDLTSVNISYPFTAYIVGVFNATTGRYLSLTDEAGSYLNTQQINAAAGTANAYSRKNGGDTNVSTAIAMDGSSPTVLVLSADATSLVLRRMDTGTSTTTTNALPTGTVRLATGWLGVGSVPSAMTGHVIALANVAHTAAERARMYAFLKSELAKPPYGLAVL